MAPHFSNLSNGPRKKHDLLRSLDYIEQVIKPKTFDKSSFTVEQPLPME